MFLILVAVGAGLCSAQTAGKKYYLVGGLFFEGMPPGVGSDNVAAFIIHEDGARHEVTELRLRKGIVLSEEVREYATPADEVPGAEAFLMSYRGGTGEEVADRRCRTDFEEGRMDRKGFSGIQSERHRRTGMEQGRCDGTSYGLELLVYRLWSLYP